VVVGMVALRMIEIILVRETEVRMWAAMCLGPPLMTGPELHRSPDCLRRRTMAGAITPVTQEMTGGLVTCLLHAIIDMNLLTNLRVTSDFFEYNHHVYAEQFMPHVSHRMFNSYGFCLTTFS